MFRAVVPDTSMEPGHRDMPLAVTLMLFEFKPLII